MRFFSLIIAVTMVFVQGITGYSGVRSPVPVPVVVAVSEPVAAAGGLVDLTFSAVEDIDFYAAYAEIDFNSRIFEFVSVGCGQLCGEGLATGGLLQEGRAGVSVTRTSAAGEPGNGSFMVVTFRVVPGAVSGPAGFAFTGLTFVNSYGDEFPADAIDPEGVDIEASVSNLLLIMPAVTTVQEGEPVIATVSLFASGLGVEWVDECLIGVSSSCSDPAGWDEAAWIPAEFSGTDDDGNMEFRADIGYMRPPGTWFVAVRASAAGSDHVYGGITGIWQGAGDCGGMVVLESAPYRYTIAGWDFDSESLRPSSSVPANRDALFCIEGANITGFGTGYRGQAARSTGWEGGSGSMKYWHTEVSTVGFSNIELSSRQSGSATGPRFFSVSYSTGGETWEYIEGGDIEVAGSWGVGVTDRLPLPFDAGGLEGLLLRWEMVSEESIGGGLTGSTGTNLIDDVLITGINPDPVITTVYPGDTNNDGVVNADDVLPLGAWWLCKGPPRVWGVEGFMPYTVEEWIPAGATYADTNGDGVVDHRDLVNVGLYFGSSAGPLVKDTSGHLSVLNIDPSEIDGAVSLNVVPAAEVRLRGVAFSIEMQGIPDDMWEIRPVYPVSGTEVEDDEFLLFSVSEGELYEGAFVLKGRGEDVTADILAGVELVVDKGWEDPFMVKLNRVTVSCSENPAGAPVTAVLSATGPLSAPPVDGRGGGGLLPNHPNPFSSYTVIPFIIDEYAGVSVEILCVRGRLLHTVYSGFTGAGQYSAVFDGSLLAPGVYLCRLVVSGRTAGIIRIVRAG